MKRLFLLMTILSLSCGLTAADLTLFDCYDKAEQAHPLQHEWSSRQQIYELNRQNLNAKWLPSLNANANAVYTSDVVEFEQILGALPFPIPAGSFQTMPKDQYKITLEANQTIFDGGAVSAGKKVEQATLQADLQALQTEFYKTREQINQVYFALLMLEKQTELAALFQNELLERKAALESGVENGVILPTNVDVLDAELVKVEQQITELDIQQIKAKNILADLIGENTEDTTLSLPSVDMPAETEIVRPEMQLFEQQKAALQMNKKLTGTQRLPKAAVFATYGYGQPPGNNFFKDTFDTYYVLGAAVSWNIFNWNTTKRTQEVLQARQNIVDAKEENFRRQIGIALKNSRAEIERVQALLESDDKLITLREKIKNAAASKLNNGTISATEFLTELNAERQARINFEMHKIQRVQAQVDYLTISGQIKN